MSNNTLFIFEFVSGGGFNEMDIPSSLFCEGFAMLRSIIEDFKELHFNITILLDKRIQLLSYLLKADRINIVSESTSYLKEFTNAVKKNEYCYIIAPEFSETLYNLTKIVKDNNKIILSVNLSGIKLAANKFKTFEFLKKNGINTPKTYLIPHNKDYFDKNYAIEKFRQLNCPIVIKQEDGVGADAIFYFKREEQIHKFFDDQDKKLERDKDYIIQEYIEGEDLSVLLLGTFDIPLILSINAQNVDITTHNKNSEYFGGYTPVENFKEIKKELLKIFNKLNLSAFSSCYGIDFMRKKDGKIYLIEINPRLTTSYIGIRNIIDVNLAQLIINSKLKKIKRFDFKYKYFSKFLRLELEYRGIKNFDELYSLVIPKLTALIPEFITPPIKFKTSLSEIEQHYSCFIATKEKSSNQSEIRIKKIIQILEDYQFEVIQ
jgi:predicted ATP-grasp superfamily ATP-dependent carboligase